MQKYSPTFFKADVTGECWAGMRENSTDGIWYSVAEVDARIAELEKDAARYRWIRDAQPYETPGCTPELITTTSGDELDAAVDAAISL